MKKKIILLVSLLAVTLAFTSCSNNNSQADKNDVQQSDNQTQNNEGTTNNEKTEGEKNNNNSTSEKKLEGPYIITTCGQSPGAVMLNMVAVQAGKTSSNDNTLSADTFTAGDNKTLIVTTGTSMKGMGAAGTDVNSEIDRCVKLIKKAKEAGLTIVGAHVEGMARRTDSSDQASIDAVMELADIILVIDDSDSDGFFTKYAQDNNKILVKVKDSLSIGDVLE